MPNDHKPMLLSVHLIPSPEYPNVYVEEVRFSYPAEGRNYVRKTYCKKEINNVHVKITN